MNIVDCHQIRIDQHQSPCDIEIQSGTITAVIGASESGKSSLLLVLSGVNAPYAGKVYIFGNYLHNLPEAEWMNSRLKIAHVLPSGSLVSHLTVLQNVMLPLNYHQAINPSHAQQQAIQLLDWLGNTADVSKLPSKLSEYERRIVNLARAIILQPDILFIDEAFANFDPLTKNRLIEIYKKINLEKNITIVIATDDVHHAGKCSQQFLFLDNEDILTFDNWEHLTNSNNEALQKLFYQ